MKKETKKKIKIAVFVIVGIVVVAGGGFMYFLNKLLPATEERISFGNEEVIKVIDKQLEGIDVEAIKAKSKLMEHKTIAQIQKSIKEKEFTYEELVAYYLINIKELDQSEMGNNAVSEVNPKAIEEARKYDKMKEDMPLKGIPILAKENINTNDMPTSSGTYALKDFIPKEDAPVIKELKSNGAIILGKTNLSELSNWMSLQNPSGYSAKKGQTHNPFNPLKVSPLGSSAGSAVAMATDLSTVTLGTETAGSIIAPASINSTVGYKPTRDSIDGEGVIPITLTLDTVGVISKTVEDALVTYNSSTTKKIDVQLDKSYIKGKRIGIWSDSDETFKKDIEEKLTAMGAEVVILEKVDTSKIDVSFILKSDFERDFNAYLEKNNAPIKSLKELIEYNKEDSKVRMRYGQTHLEDSLSFQRDDEKVKEIVEMANESLNKVMGENKLDAIVYQDNQGALLTAVAGAPEVTVPFGHNDNQPIGATFCGKIDDDANILNISYSFEQNTKMRELPKK